MHKINSNQFLYGILPPTIRRNMESLRLYLKVADPKHLLHSNLYVQPAPDRLRSRRPLRPYVESLSVQGFSPPPIPDYLKSYLSAFTNSPPGCNAPRRAWVQLNRLRTGHGKFKANLYKMGLAEDKYCDCGGIQSASHILNPYTVLSPPCSITNTTNQDLLDYLCKSSF